MTTNGPEFGNPLRKFKLVFLGEQSGKLLITMCTAGMWSFALIFCPSMSLSSKLVMSPAINLGVEFLLVAFALKELSLWSLALDLRLCPCPDFEVESCSTILTILGIETQKITQDCLSTRCRPPLNRIH